MLLRKQLYSSSTKWENLNSGFSAMICVRRNFVSFQQFRTGLSRYLCPMCIELIKLHDNAWQDNAEQGPGADHLQSLVNYITDLGPPANQFLKWQLNTLSSCLTFMCVVQQRSGEIKIHRI